MVTVTDKEKALDHFDESDLFISILDPGFKKFPLKGSKEKHFIARFEDTEHPSELEWMKMNREVRSILSWVQHKKPSVDTKILVHCHAGVSRSSAIAWLILIMQGREPLEAFQSLFKSRSQIWPNLVVLGIGSKFLNLDPGFMKLAIQIDEEIREGRGQLFGYC
jgi:predicted protein tyrosine phosphatase